MSDIEKLRLKIQELQFENKLKDQKICFLEEIISLHKTQFDNAQENNRSADENIKLLITKGQQQSQKEVIQQLKRLTDILDESRIELTIERIKNGFEGTSYDCILALMKEYSKGGIVKDGTAYTYVDDSDKMVKDTHYEVTRIICEHLYVTTRPILRQLQDDTLAKHYEEAIDEDLSHLDELDSNRMATAMWLRSEASIKILSKKLASIIR